MSTVKLEKLNVQSVLWPQSEPEQREVIVAVKVVNTQTVTGRTLYITQRPVHIIPFFRLHVPGLRRGFGQHGPVGPDHGPRVGQGQYPVLRG